MKINFYSKKIQIQLLLFCFLTGMGAMLHAQTPVAGFSVNAVQGCAPFSVNFTNTSTGATSYQWNFGNGNFSTLAQPQNVYVAAGSYSVTLIAIASNGLSDTLTISNYITSLPGPVVHFTASSLTGCASQTNFSFNNISTGAVSYFWDFGDGTSSLQANPTKYYDQPDTYNVSLLATSNVGCESVYNLPQGLVVNPVPTAEFSTSPTITCNLNHAFVFTPTQTNAASYLWNFGDGTTSTQAIPSKVYGVSGNFTVSLYVTNSFGCIDTVSKTNYVKIRTPVFPQIIASDSSGCAPFATTFSTDITNATSYAWTFGNGQTSTNASQLTTFSNSGVFSPMLTVTMSNGCSYSATASNLITSYALPSVNFSLTNTSGCAPLNVVTDNNTNGASSYLWQFFDGLYSTDFQPTHTYLNPGVYSVRLTATSAQGCVAQQQLNNAVSVISPSSVFSATDTLGCPPLAVNFTNSSVGGTSYLWNFGDGTTSTQANPVHVYQNLGQYDVTLITSNNNGCRDTLMLTNFVDVMYQQATYTAPPAISGCAPFEASFSLNAQTGMSYEWNFGDGSTSNLSNPSHEFNEPGTYVVSLTVNDGTPCSMIYTTFQTVIVEGILPEFMVEVGICPPFPVTFTDTTSDAVSWLWDFGDGSTSTAETPTYIFSNTSNQHVGLTTTTASGCVYSYVGFNAVNFDPASATFTSSSNPGPFPRTVQFTSTNPVATGWLWNFGDGTTSTQENPIHVYQVEGDYEVTLTIQTQDCSISSSGSAFPENLAVDVSLELELGGSNPNQSNVLIDPLRGCIPMNVLFRKQDVSHNVILWVFGDGATSTQQSPLHMYDEQGLYTVYYIAQTPYGLDTFQYNQSVLVGGGQPDFTLSQQGTCVSTNVQVSPSNAGALESILWTFGDGATSTSFNASHIFYNANTSFTVLMNVIDTLGCSSSSFQSFLVSPPVPVIDFPSSICRDTVDFTNSFANQVGFNFEWNFGDGTTSNEASPSHYYTSEGTYTVSLTVSTPSGCTSTVEADHTILVAVPQASWTLAGPSEGCAPLATSFVCNSPAYQVAWFFSDGSYLLGTADGTGYTNPVNKIFTTPGVYTFVQRVFSSILPGCVYQENFPNVITVHGADADFSFTQTGLCLPLTAQFTDLSEDAVSWLWDFGNGMTSTVQNPTMNFTSMPGDSVTLQITTAYGCTSTITKLGIARFQAEASAAYIGACNPLPVTFTASMDGNIDWQWNFGDGATGIGSNPSHLYTENGIYQASVIVTSSGNCRDTAYITLPINVIGPIANFSSPTPASCAPSVVEFFDNSTSAVSWLWDFGDNTQSTIPNPVKLYDLPGTYTIQLIVTNANGCSDTLIRQDYVTVLGPATSFTASSISSCLGNSIQFTDLSNGAVEWEWNFGEGTTSTDQNPTFSYDEEGTYVVTLFSKDTIGCSAFYTITTPIAVHPYPVANFVVSDTSACSPFLFTIDNLSVGATTYNWNFGDMSTSSAFEPSHSYVHAGSYTISLVSTSAFGCSDTATFQGMNALLVPTAGLAINTMEGCTPLSVSYSNTSTSTQNPIYNWNFGNGNFSTDVNPNTVYSNPGFYSVQLTVTNQNGCADTLTLPAMVQVYDTLPAPISPIGRVTVENTTSVLIEWEESLANDFSSYVLFRRNIQSGAFEQIAQILDQHTLSYIETGLNTLDNAYCYKLQTIDRCGYAIVLDSLIEHCTINVEVATLLNNTIEVTWTPYVGKSVSQYRVFRTEENSSVTDDLGTVAGDITSFIDSTVFCPLKFKYEVKAEALNGQSHVFSNSDFDFSDPIANLFVDQQVNTSRSTVVQNQSILTEWLRPAIMGNRVNGYKVYRSIDNREFLHIATVGQDQTYYIDDEVDVDHAKYYYHIMATNACELVGKEGISSDNVVLQAEATGDVSIKLEWTPYLGWGNNGVGFYILEKQNDDGSWDIIQHLPGSVLTTVDEN
jgi:PKD repeat protein